MTETEQDNQEIKDNSKADSRELIAISKCLARAKDRMSIQEKKLAAICFSKIEWKESGNNCVIWLDKAEVVKQLNRKLDSTDQSTFLRQLANSMRANSGLTFSGADRKEWNDMSLFIQSLGTKDGKMMIKINPDAMKLLEGLKSEYITLFLSDILLFKSTVDGTRAYILYEHLRLNSDSRKPNSRTITTKGLKELFNIPGTGKGAYMRKDGTFDRKSFERFVLDPALAMLVKCKHVVLSNFGTDDNGNMILYNKVKRGFKVAGYEFAYKINKDPNYIMPPDTIVVKTAESSKKTKKSDECPDNEGFMTVPDDVPYEDFTDINPEVGEEPNPFDTYSPTTDAKDETANDDDETSPFD